MRKLATWLLVAAGVFVFGNALADLTVKDGGGTTRTIKNFVCETTKLCNATVLIASDGTEISPATSAQAGSLTETAPASDTASSGLNGRLQRVAQRVTSLIALLPTSLGAGGGLKVDGSGTALPVTVTNTNNNGQAAASASSPVVVAKNSGTGSTVAGAAVGTAGSASTEVVTVQGIAGGTPVPVANGAADPCQSTANSTARGNITSATTTRIITPSASNKTYICSVDLFSFAANNVGIYEGTGGTCGTGKAGVIGGTTTSNGISFPAQGGMVKGGAGFFVWNTAGTNVDFCLETSTTGPLAYFVKYVQAP